MGGYFVSDGLAIGLSFSNKSESTTKNIRIQVIHL